MWMMFLWMVHSNVAQNISNSFALYKKGNYVPLVFMLLPGKSEVVYQYAFSSLIRICREKGLEFPSRSILVEKNTVSWS
jgi:hypothetical protein